MLWNSALILKRKRDKRSWACSFWACSFWACFVGVRIVSRCSLQVPFVSEYRARPFVCWERSLFAFRFHLVGRWEQNCQCVPLEETQRGRSYVFLRGVLFFPLCWSVTHNSSSTRHFVGSLGLAAGDPLSFSSRGCWVRSAADQQPVTRLAMRFTVTLLLPEFCRAAVNSDTVLPQLSPIPPAAATAKVLTSKKSLLVAEPRSVQSPCCGCPRANTIKVLLCFSAFVPVLAEASPGAGVSTAAQDS